MQFHIFPATKVSWYNQKEKTHESFFLDGPDGTEGGTQSCFLSSNTVSWAQSERKTGNNFFDDPEGAEGGDVRMGDVRLRFSSKTLSLRPSLSSGMPDKNDFIFKAPRISEWRTVPLEDTSKLSFSTTWVRGNKMYNN